MRVAVGGGGGGGSLLSHYAYMYSLLEHPCDDDVDSKPSCARQRREDVWISFTFPSTWVDTPCNDSWQIFPLQFVKHAIWLVKNLAYIPCRLQWFDCFDYYWNRQPHSSTHTHKREASLVHQIDKLNFVINQYILYDAVVSKIEHSRAGGISESFDVVRYTYDMRYV